MLLFKNCAQAKVDCFEVMWVGERVRVRERATKWNAMIPAESARRV